MENQLLIAALKAQLVLLEIHHDVHINYIKSGPETSFSITKKIEKLKNKIDELEKQL